MILRVLQVEDSESDAALIVRALESGGYEVRARRVEDPPDLRVALEEQAWDVIIADYNLPGFDAPTALKIVHEMGRDTPFLVVSGVIGEEVAVAMMKAGTHDYIMKNNLTRLAPAVEREMREFRYRRELARQRQVLERQSRLLNLSRDAIVTANANRVVETWNFGAEEIYGWTESEAVGEVMHRLLETSAAVSVNEIDATLRQKGHWEGEVVHTRRDGQRIVVESRQVLVRDTRGFPVGILEINRDVTERKRMEERLQDTPKAEEPAAVPPAAATSVWPNGSGAVLIVDGDRSVRSMAAMVLSQRGFRVYQASTGPEAIDCLTQKGAAIRFVVLDPSLPQTHGAEVLSLIAQLRPGLHVFLTIGHTDEGIQPHLDGLGSLNFLSQPYTGEQILQLLLAALDRDAHPAPEVPAFSGR